MDYNVTEWHSPASKSPNHWKAAALECEALCDADERCCTWTYCTPEGGSHDPERCCLKWGIPKEVAASTHWTGAPSRASSPSCQNPTPPYPGPVWGKPTFHNVPQCLWEGGWHDVAGALTVNGTHHVFMGCPSSGGWHHAASTDLVHWEDLGLGPVEVQEPWGTSSPCSGFVTIDDDGKVCAGFRQCSSTHGIGPDAWNVPLELRCATNENLTQWSAPDYIFDVFFNRALPYDPVRPWFDNGMWHALIAMDGCNASSVPCDAGGSEILWTSPKLHGPGAKWTRVGPMFTSNVTVLSGYQPGAWLDREFVTPEFFGSMPGQDPLQGATRVFTNNVAGPGCCSGTTAFFLGTQSGVGEFEVDYTDPNAVGMVDWGAFALDGGKPPDKGVAGLIGTQSRGLSMARTLGSASPNQVTVSGRRVLIGWLSGATAVQSLPRDLTISKHGELLQAFVPELGVLRASPTPLPPSGSPANASLAAEIVVDFTLNLDQGFPQTPFGINLQVGDGGSTSLLLDLPNEHILIGDRAAPYIEDPDNPTHIHVHVFVDHGIIEMIVNNRTAATIYDQPKTPGQTGASLRLPNPSAFASVQATAYQLKSI